MFSDPSIPSKVYADYYDPERSLMSPKPHVVKPRKNSPAPSPDNYSWWNPARYGAMFGDWIGKKLYPGQKPVTNLTKEQLAPYQDWARRLGFTRNVKVLGGGAARQAASKTTLGTFGAKNVGFDPSGAAVVISGGKDHRQALANYYREKHPNATEAQIQQAVRTLHDDVQRGRANAQGVTYDPTKVYAIPRLGADHKPIKAGKGYLDFEGVLDPNDHTVIIPATMSDVDPRKRMLGVLGYNVPNYRFGSEGTGSTSVVRADAVDPLSIAFHEDVGHGETPTVPDIGTNDPDASILPKGRPFGAQALYPRALPWFLSNFSERRIFADSPKMDAVQMIHPSKPEAAENYLSSFPELTGATRRIKRATSVPGKAVVSGLSLTGGKAKIGKDSATDIATALVTNGYAKQTPEGYLIPIKQPDQVMVDNFPQWLNIYNRLVYLYNKHKQGAATKEEIEEFDKLYPTVDYAVRLSHNTNKPSGLGLYDSRMLGTKAVHG